MTPHLLARILLLLGCFGAGGVMAQDHSVETLEQAERNVQRTPKPVLERARRELATLPITSSDRGRWLALGSEAAHALALPDVALNYAKEGLDRPDLPVDLELRLSIAHAQALDLIGRPQESISILMTVLGTLEHGNFDQQFLVDALTARASAYYSASNFRASLADLLRVYPIAAEHGHRTLRADVTNALGNVYAAIEDYPHAIQFYRETIDYAIESQSWVRASIAEYSLAAVYRRSKEWDQAEDYFERSRQHSIVADDEQGVAYAEYGLAQVALQKGELEKAETMYRHALPVFTNANDVLPQANIAHGLAQIAYQRKNFVAALAHIDNALELLDKVADLALGHQLTALKAEIQLALGQERTAFETLKRSAEMKEASIEARSSESLSELRVRFDSERQEQQNALLRTENQLNAAHLAEQRQTARLYAVSMVTLLMILGFVVYLAYRSKQLRQRLAHQALTDDLTGVANRRQAMAVLSAEFERARRYRTALCIASLDLDHFKQINDRFGHAAGDEVLKAFSRAMAASLRKTDCFCRVGGEEFLAILPHTEINVGELVMERMRYATLALSCPALQGELQPSVSIGLAVLLDEDNDIDALLKRADEALYRAKQTGRNRVVSTGA